jgi:hypothetical protein
VCLSERAGLQFMRRFSFLAQPDVPEADFWPASSRVGPWMQLPACPLSRSSLRASAASFENIGNSVEVMHGVRVLAPYEVCSEQVRLVLQQAVEWFRPFRPLSAGFGTTAQQPPQQDLLPTLLFCRAV